MVWLPIQFMMRRRLTPQPKHGPALADNQAALLRSQAGHGVRHSSPHLRRRPALTLVQTSFPAPSAAPCTSSSTLLPVWPSPRHHRAGCANAGVMGRRGWAWRMLQFVSPGKQEHVSERIWRSCLMGDAQKFVVDGLPLWGGSQLIGCGHHHGLPCLARWCRSAGALQPPTGSPWRQVKDREGLTPS